MKNLFDQHYYQINKFYMSNFGIWPEQSLFIRCLLPSLATSILVSIIIPELIRMHELRQNVDKVIEGILPILLMMVSTTKLLNSCFKVGKMRKVINRISHDWEYLKDPQNEEVLHNYATRSRFITVAYSIYLFGSMFVSFFILPIVPIILDVLIPLNETRPRKPLFEAEYGVDPDDYFFEILGHAYLTTLVTVINVVTFDTMYYVTVNHACALFKVVGINLKLMLEGQHSKDNDGFKTICYCVNLHKNALSFADLLESTYSAAFAIIIFDCLVCLSISGVMLLISIGHINEMIRSAMFIVSILLSLYVNTVPAQNLIDHSQYIHTVAYDFTWYEMSIKVQKLLVLIMLRSKKPCVLTAGKVYVISMESYSSVIQTAVSYFTVLSSFR